MLSDFRRRAGKEHRPTPGLLVLAVCIACFAQDAIAGTAGDGVSPDSTWTLTAYEYDEVNLQPRVVEIIASDGAMRRVVTTYAYEPDQQQECRLPQFDMGPSGSHQLAAVCRTEAFGGELINDEPTWDSEPLSCSRTRYRAHLGVGVPDRQYAGCEAIEGEFETAHFVSYDAFGRPDEIRSSAGLYGIIEYEGRQVVAITRTFEHNYGSEPYEVELTETFDYDTLGRLASATDENGTTLRYTYDGLGRLTKVERSVNEGPKEVLAEHEYFLSALNGPYSSEAPNYVRSRLFPGGTAPEEISTGYFDGLGRELQTQQMITGMPGNGHVAVAFPEYDDLGRPERQWRPVEIASPSAHGFIPLEDVAAAAMEHYEDAPGNDTDEVEELGRPYSTTRYEENPLSRVSRERAPGTSVGGDFSGSGNAFDYSYGVAEPTWAGVPQAEFMVFTEARDEDQRWTRTYTDGLGRERFVERGMNQTQETLTELIYDAVDRLIEVRPPHYFDPPSGSSANDWVTGYVYDTRGLLLTKATPDTRNSDETGPGEHRYLYDRHGRLRYSQDPEQRAGGVVAFTRYDPMGRVLMSGVGRPVPCEAPATEQSCWDEVEKHLTHETVIPDVLDPQGPHWEYPGPNRRAVYHYDDPTQQVVVNENFIARVEHWPFSGDPSFAYGNTQGRLVAVAYRTEGLWQSGPSVRWQSTFFAYDGDGNVSDRWVRTSTAGQPHWDRFAYAYDRQGRLVYESAEVASYELHHFYAYDQRGLLTEVSFSTDGVKPPSADLELVYDVSGAVTERVLGEGAAEILYQYDVAGRLVTIGDVTDYEPEPDPPFAARYTYTPGGLISEIETRSTAAVQACSGGYACTDRWRYMFTYDNLARLTDANYLGFDAPTQEFRPHPAFDISAGYDRQGNIIGLTRSAPGAVANQTSMVDILSYTYKSGTNRLLEVEDWADENDLTWDAKPTTFTYDRAGNMIEMVETLSPVLDRTTEVLRVDERNLPERLRITLGTDQLGVNYAYDAGGQRIKKVTFTDGFVDPESDPHYAFERYVRDGMRLVAVLDGEGKLKWWNVGGIAGLAGRLDPELHLALNDSLAIATAQAGLTADVWALLDRYLELELEVCGGDPSEAPDIASYAEPGVLQAALDALPDAVAAAHGAFNGADAAGAEHYKLTLGPTRAEIASVLENDFEYDPQTAALCADPAGTNVASDMAQIVGMAVASSYEEEPTGDFDRRYYIADHLGTIRAVVNEQGQTIEARDHYPYGLMMPGRSFTAGQETREGYTGHELDAETGMYYAGARYYMPALARWTAVDPLAELFEAWSPYNYVMGNPLLLIDRDGRKPDDPPYRVSNGVLLGPNVTHDITDVTHRPAMRSIVGVVLHRTAGSTAQGAVDWSKSQRGETGFHLVVDKDGSIIQLNNLNNRANHVGRPTGDITSYNSIGIEVVGLHLGQDGEDKWEPLTPEQITSTTGALIAILEEYDLYVTDLYPHENVSRKTPGEGETVLHAIIAQLISQLSILLEHELLVQQ